MLTRRSFLKMTTAGTLALYLSTRVGEAPRLFSQIPGPSLSPGSIPKYQTPLLVPPAMPKVGKIKRKNGQEIDYYEIAVRQFQQQILPATLPKTTVWGYGPLNVKRSSQIFNAPSLTIETKAGTPVRIKWVNELMDANGSYLPHLLAVDPTLHWANPSGGLAGRDQRPNFTSTPGRYTGPVPMVSHVHGALFVGDESDGYAEAWYLPKARNLPAGYATVGRWYDFFKSKAKKKGFLAPGKNSWEAGTAVFQYPNTQRATTSWYHDHTLGMTRLNVYAGPAGFFNIRGGPGDDVRDARYRDDRPGSTGRQKAVLPGPAPALGDKPGTIYYEIPIAIQDRSFNADGSLFYPDSRAFFDGITGPYVPDTDIAPIWNPEFFGNAIMVNGNTWPFLNVEQRRYRFRLLNGCNSRFLILDFSGVPGLEVWQIGNEGGFLAQPVNMTALTGGKFLMGPAERADVIVDFTNVALGTYTLKNIGPDEPFKGFNPDGSLADGLGGTIPPAEPATTGQVMQFNVSKSRGKDLSTPPRFMVLPTIEPIPSAIRTRQVALVEEMSMYFDGPMAAMQGVVAFGSDGVGHYVPKMWMDPITENPAVGETEIWEIYNATADAHPMHLHEVLMELVNRQGIVVDEFARTVVVDANSIPQPPQPWESGYKDTVIAYPGQVTRVRHRFDTAGQFVWHCHIVEHEDNEMMRPYSIGPIQNPNSMPMAADVPSADLEEEFIPEEQEATNKVFIPVVSNQ